MFKTIVFGFVGAVALLITSAPAEAQRGPGYGSERVRCESRNHRYESCPVQWRDAQLVRQTSDTPCRKGSNWGVDRRGIWVDRGCAGEFVEAGRGGGHGRPGGPGGWNPGADWDRDIRFTCQSRDRRYNFCSVDTGQGSQVRIERQTSETACIEGRTWGWNRAGVWVDRGCSAVFVVQRRWR